MTTHPFMFDSDFQDYMINRLEEAMYPTVSALQAPDAVRN